jgi:hypothetical protein
MKILVIVESFTKEKTIQMYLLKAKTILLLENIRTCKYLQ